jgi:carbamoyltransferase
MHLLSINFGHDASLALFCEGALVDFEELERVSRLKWHLGMRAEYIEAFLARTGRVFADVDLVALSSTQGWAMVHSDAIQMERGWREAHASHSDWFELWSDEKSWEGDAVAEWYRANHVTRQQLTHSTPSVVRSEFTVPFLAGPVGDNGQLLGLASEILSSSTAQLKEAKANFLCPYAIAVRGVERPAFYVNHHTSHAYYAYFYSSTKDSVVCTHDGATSWQPFHGGGFYLADAERGVLPLVSHNFALGRIYNQVGGEVGVDEPGKLMGLSAYANPSLDILHAAPAFIDFFAHPVQERNQIPDLVSQVLAISRRSLSPRKRSIAKFKFQLENVEYAAQAAANMQYLAEVLYVTCIGGLARTINEAWPRYASLDLTGGFTLNCPSNSLLWHRCAPMVVNPLPGAGDTGLAVGAAVAVLDFLGHPIQRQIDTSGTVAAFPPSSLAHNAGDQSLAELTRVDLRGQTVATFIATQLVAGSVICLHRGRSEVGPRALGHRSIIAHAVREEVRDRINLAKGREPWRPLAPICRREDFSRYFSGEPSMGRFMLFTCKVIGDHIPAVTHVDGTARVQCVDGEDDWIHGALTLLAEQGHDPVIVNTSFNCSGEPLVETLDHAVRSFVAMKFDFLVTELGVFRPTALHGSN